MQHDGPIARSARRHGTDEFDAQAEAPLKNKKAARLPWAAMLFVESARRRLMSQVRRNGWRLAGYSGLACASTTVRP